MIATLDVILDAPGVDVTTHPVVTAFPDSDAVPAHVSRATQLIVENTSSVAESVTESADANPAILFSGAGADGQYRRLVLRSQGNDLPFLSTFPNQYVFIAMSDMVVDRFEIVGRGDNIYSAPSRGLRLKRLEPVSLRRGQVAVRRNTREMARLDGEIAYVED